MTMTTKTMMIEIMNEFLASGYENECDEFNLRNEEPTDVPPTFRGACADCGQIETECCLKLKGGKVMCCDCLYPEAPEEEEEEEETDDE